ncbi:MAG TPA: MFS transporter [Streptosporangiaceae bacterium]|nr:MFS transporter [Streptosporangiaceae bacterium]
MNLPSLTVLAEPRFRLLWIASTASAFGSAFTAIATSFGVLNSGGSASSLGLVLTGGTVTRLIFFPIGGVWADRVPRRTVMIGANLFQMLVQAAAAAILLAGIARVWELLLASSMLAAGIAMFAPASTGLVAEVVSSQRLQEANALLAISRQAASLLGPALSGLLIAAGNAGWSFAFDALTFGVSALCLAGVRSMSRPGRSRTSLLADITEGWRELTKRSWYWLNLISHAFWNLGLAVFFVIGPAVSRARLDGAIGWGLVSAGLAAGGIVGGLISLRLVPRRPLVAGNLALMLGALPLLALAHHLELYVVIISAGLAFAGQVFLNSVWSATVQRLMPPAALARLSSYDYLISYAIMPIGFALAGPVSATAGIGRTLVIGGLMMLVPSALTAFMPSVRKVTDHDEYVVTGPDPVTR